MAWARASSATISRYPTGGMTTTFDAIQSHTYGPQIADDDAAIPAGSDAARRAEAAFDAWAGAGRWPG